MRSGARTVAPALWILPLAAPLGAQTAPATPDMSVDADTRAEIIDGVLARLNAAYVFPDKAREMEAAVRERASRGEYDRISSGRALADSLTAHLQAVSRDRHLRVAFSPRPIQVERPDAAPSAEMRERRAAMLRRINFGFEKVERLEGNIGYLELRGFAPAAVDGADDAVAAAMDFLARTDALIIDLRRNGGGDPAMVRLLSSYLFDAEPVHLNSLYWRPDDRTDEFWTLREVSGTRYGPDRPVYVLTSERTFSGAEEFSYNLKNLERATIIGETTGGGAHPGGMQRVTAHFGVWVPSGRAINPITGTNWEGTGVEPHVAVDAEQALTTAHVTAVRALLEAANDPERRQALERVLRDLGAAK